MKYEITLPAENDLIEIFGYTVEKWGSRQAKNYVSKIVSSLEQIADGKLFCRRAFSKNEEIKLVLCEYHYIFFLTGKKPIIFAVLHEKMDFVAVLNKRLSGRL